MLVKLDNFYKGSSIILDSDNIDVVFYDHTSDIIRIKRKNGNTQCSDTFLSVREANEYIDYIYSKLQGEPREC